MMVPFNKQEGVLLVYHIIKFGGHLTSWVEIILILKNLSGKNTPRKKDSGPYPSPSEVACLEEGRLLQKDREGDQEGG